MRTRAELGGTYTRGQYNSFQGRKSLLQLASPVLTWDMLVRERFQRQGANLADPWLNYDPQSK